MCVRDSTRFWWAPVQIDRCVRVYIYRHICIQLSRRPIYCRSRTRVNSGAVGRAVSVVGEGCGKKGHIPLKITLMSGKGWGTAVLCYHPSSRPPPPPPSQPNQLAATPRIYAAPPHRKRNAWVFLSTFGHRRHLCRARMRRQDSCFILGPPHKTASLAPPPRDG